MRTPISSPDAPAPSGTYSSAIACGGFLFLAGQAPCALDGTIMRGTIAEQVRLTLDNLDAVAQAGGSSLARAVKVTVYLAAITDWAAMDAAYSAYFDGCPPARTTVECGLNGFDVEIDAIVAAP